MVVTAVVCTLFVVALAGVVAAEPFPTRKELHNITSYDSTYLHAVSYVPDVNSTSTEKFPLVIFPNSWALSIDFEYTKPQEFLAKGGYITFAYQTRGWFKSGGNIGIAGPQDLKDAQEIINYCLDTFPNVDKDQIAFVGISYGGGIGMLAGAKIPQVKAVVSMSGWMNMFESLDWNWTPSLVWGNILKDLAELLGRPNKDLAELLQNLLTFTNVDYTINWAKERSAETFQDELEKRQVPVMVANNMEDNLFHSNNQLSWWQKYTGPKRIILSQGTHAEAEAPFLVLPGLNTIWNPVWVDTFNFLDYHLKGVQNGIMSEGLVKMQLQSGLLDKYLTYDDAVWPPKNGYESLKYTFGERRAGERFGTLDVPTESPRPGAGQATIQYTKDVEMSCGTPVLSPLLTPFTPFRSNLNAAKTQHELIFRSQPMTRDTVVCGSIRIEGLTVVSTTDRFQVYGYAYDEPRNAEAILLAHTVRSEWQNATKNEPFKLDPMDFRVTCKNVPRNHRLVVGFNLHNELYGPAADTSATSVTFIQDDAASVTFPVVSGQ